MGREVIPTVFIALVICRRDDRFLVVHERKHGQRWFLPAGRVEPGESLADGARRECLEEAGLPVVLEGVLRIEHTPLPDLTRLRVFFTARPADDRPPKSEPDDESLEAAWRTIPELEEMSRARLLRDGFIETLKAVAAGAPIAPLSVLGSED